MRIITNETKDFRLLPDSMKTLPAADAVTIWYIGQMGLVIRHGALAIVIDPVLNDLTDAQGHTRRLYPPLFAPETADFADYVFCSHNHADHLNMKTLLPISKASDKTRFVVPAPVANVLIDGGIAPSRIIAAEAGRPIPLSPSDTALPIAAAHEEYCTDEAGRHYFLGYHFTLGNLRIFHAGDTLATDRLLSDLRDAGSADIAFMPINGRDAERHARGIVGNMNAEEAAGLAASLKFGLSIPMHYDMVRGNTAEPEDFVQACAALPQQPANKVLRLGERMEVSLI
ncbi:MAG: MBL fold metallo-hydrolase [Clostridia bacterium]|nr:MBL fold metallo-hydrolase [Clostridia bacterium]